MKTFGALLRSYQEEINSLTKKGAFASQCFMDALSAFSQLRDPSHALEVSLVRLSLSLSLELSLLNSLSLSLLNSLELSLELS